VDGYSVKAIGQDFGEAHRIVWTGVSMSFQGLNSQY